jgi:hypothetical protein
MERPKLESIQTLYQRPAKVIDKTTDTGGIRLVGYFDGRNGYDLSEAVREYPSAYDDLMRLKVGDTEAAKKFIMGWGFLDGQDVDKSYSEMLDEIYDFQNRLILLTRVNTAFRGNKPSELINAIHEYWKHYGAGLNETQVRARSAGNVKIEALYLCRNWHNPGRDFAPRLIAHELEVNEKIAAVKTIKGWNLAVCPQLYRLRQAILYSLGRRYLKGSAYYRVCGTCGNAFISVRPDTRYCDSNCAARFRMRKFRAKTLRSKSKQLSH